MPVRGSVLVLSAGLLVLSACGYSGAALSAPSSTATSVSPSPSSRPVATPSSSKPASPPAATHPRPTPRPSTTAVAPTSVPGLPTPGVVYPAGSGPLIVLNPGHNGGNASHPAEINQQVPAGFGEMKACDTTGTNTDAGYTEHEFNWEVAQAVASILKHHGVRVIMTRPNDTGVGPCVNQRAAIQNTKGAVASISIHADGAPADGHGFHVNEDSQTPEGASAASVAGSRRLGTALHDALQAESGLVPSTYIGTNGYVYRNDFAGLNMVSQPSSFLELGNMRNAGDAALQTSAAGRQRIATAIATGILNYLAGR